MAFTGTVRHRPPRRRPSRRLLTLVLVVVVVVVGASTATVLLLGPRQSGEVAASSTGSGSDLQALTQGATGSIRWRSVRQTTGAWVETSWASPRSVDRVRLASAGKRTFTSARLAFSDGSAVLVTPDGRGDADVSFPARSVRSARLTIAEGVRGVSSVSLASFVVSDGGARTASGTPALRASASPTASGSSAAGLTDGDPQRGALGAEWQADQSASSARAKVRWAGTRPISAVRLWGPTAVALDPGYSAAAALNGTLRFSDGSTVRISGIAGGAGGPTTVAFTPRMVTSVTAVLERTIPQATIGLRAMTVYPVGDVPRIEAASDLTTTTDPPPGVCDGATAPAGTPAADVVSLVCPASGSSVGDRTTVRVAAPAGTALTAQIAAGSGAAQTALRQVASATAGADGTADLSFSSAGMPTGPFSVLVSSPVTPLRPLHVQLYRAGGATGSVTRAKDGSDVVYDEEFDRNISISGSGAGASYGAAQPRYWGPTQFGDAVFDEPSSGAGTFSVIDGALRIRAQPLGDRTDTAGAHRKYLGGLISSLRVGASGFSAQYGYYEARMMAPAGNGTWPAFWMMSDDSATKATRSTEVDAVELYGNRTKQTCHSTHNYVLKQDVGSVRCIETAVPNDWAVGWHTYGVRIGPGEAQFYVDGKHVMTQTGLTNSEQPFFFMANLALGGGWPVDLSPTGGQAELWIDWIRVSV